MIRAIPIRTYRVGVAIALATCFVTVWTTIVRDDGNGAGFFMVIMAAGVGAFAGQFRADAMARTMVGVALMQAVFGLAIATAPVTAATPDGPLKALVFNCIFTAAWLLSAACFRSAWKHNPEAADV